MMLMIVQWVVTRRLVDDHSKKIWFIAHIIKLAWRQKIRNCVIVWKVISLFVSNLIMMPNLLFAEEMNSCSLTYCIRN